jgi:hypothetical protein
LRRTIFVPTTVAAASRARHALVAMAVAALLVLALALVDPVVGQEETTAQTANQTQTVAKDKDASGEQEQVVQGAEQQAEAGDEQAADPLEGQTANITASSIGPIAVAGCEAAGETASITVADADGTQEAFTDDEDIVFEFGQQGITITSEEGGDLQVDGEFDPGIGEVVSSEGISCDNSGGQRSDDNNENNAKNAEDLEDLSCEELLVLFRGESGSEAQYADAAVFADSEVRARVEVCLEKEIVQGTAADEDLPDTGGPSLLALAVLGVVSAAAGLSVIRGGRR